MPLQLRRGTNAERQLITPQEGELIYVTDYAIRNVSSMWIGDGFTPGGNPVDSNAGTMSLSSLTDVDITTVPPQFGDVLKWNGQFFTPQPDIDTQGTGILGLSDLIDVDITSIPPEIGDVLKWDGFVFVPQPDINSQGVIRGETYTISVNGEDSSLIIDSINNTVSGTFIGEIASSQAASIVNAVVDADTLKLYQVVSSINGSKLSIKGYSGSIEAPTVPNDFDRQGIGFDFFTGVDFETTSIIYSYYKPSTAGYMALTVKDASSNFFVNAIEIDGDANKTTISGQLDLNNDVILGRITRTNRDTLTPVNGMMLYNTTLNRFQGYQNGIWINLDDGTEDIT